MKMLSRAIFWGVLFVTTIALAIGLSLLAMRVRAAVDARRGASALPLAAGPLPGILAPSVVQAADDATPEDGQLARTGDTGTCEVPWGIEQFSSPPNGQVTEPAPLVRGCCSQFQGATVALTETAPEAAAPAPTPWFRFGCH